MMQVMRRTKPDRLSHRSSERHLLAARRHTQIILVRDASDAFAEIVW